MATPRLHHQYTIGDFVRLEEYSNVRHEFWAGQIYAMAGGTPEHGTYAANVIGLLTGQLGERPCRVQTSDVRIRVTATGLDTYADASVVCGRADRDAEDPNAIINPVLLVEVLSPSTEHYDRGEKLEHYKQIESLREVLLVSPDQRRLELVRRGPEGRWEAVSAGVGEVLRLESIDVAVSVDAVFRDPFAGS
jgi:Uma2 family endonuclease